MSLEPGQTLLHFRLVDKLGEGGMGEVWRAVDTTLDREVAVKVLPASVADDRDRILRLEREAKLLASLNHPNIAAIYGFPEAGTRRFLAMELVRGEDLARILTRGPMPVREAIDAARQVAAALEAAHDNGVIHRDLKPANVKRTPEGQIKVLDFGLAKALESAAPDLARSATVTSAGSQAGMILGTASYMSPEQARGLAVDRRTDLWAFGCLLYEMLTGVKAFDGATVTDVLAAVVTGEPDWSKLPAATPASVRRLLRRCLEKDMRKRLRDAGDASLLLDDNPDDAKSGPVPLATRSAERPKGNRALLAVGAFVVAAAGIAGGFALARRGEAAKPASAVGFTRLTFSRGTMRSARFAPDGKTVIYGAAWNGPPIKLYMGRVESADATPIAAQAAELLSISKTGEMAVALGLAYNGWMGEGTLARMSLLGGGAREMLPGVRAADWNPDGSELAIVRRVGGVDRLEYPPGKVLYSNAGYIADVRFSPDGKHIAFADHPVYADDLGDLAVVDLAGHKTTLRTGLQSIRGLAWAPGGKEIWCTGGGPHWYGIFASDLAGHQRDVYPSVGAIELFDIAPDGRVLIGDHAGSKRSQALLAGFTEPREIVVPGEASQARDVSHDGRTVLVSDQRAQGYVAYAVRADRPGAVRLGTGDAFSLSPDGASAIVVAADLKSLYVSPLGTGDMRPVPNPDGILPESIIGWMPDGKRLICAGRRGSEDTRGYTLDAVTGTARAFGDPGTTWHYFTALPLSPDGRYVVLQDKDLVLRRYPVDGGPPVAIPGLEPGDTPLGWSDDGGALYVTGAGFPIPILKVSLATGRREPWLTITPNDAAGMRYSTLAITPNGKYWALSTATLLTNLFVVEGLR